VYSHLGKKNFACKHIFYFFKLNLLNFYLFKLSEINEFDLGLTIELWNRGILWDKLLGVSWLPLMQINHSLPNRVCFKNNFNLTFF
jgi:hypothetical protein